MTSALVHAEAGTSVGRNVIRFGAWGALWGLVLGLGLLAPGLLLSHHLRPQTIGQWFWLDTGLLLVFASCGAAIAVPGLLLVTDVLRWLSFRFREPTWAIGLLTAPVLALTYTLLAWMIGQYYLFDYTNRSSSLPSVTLTGLAVLLAIAGGLWFAYRSIIAAKIRPPAELLVWSLMLTAAMELAHLPQTLPLPAAVVSAAAASEAAGPDSPHAPLLFVGLDAGNWASIDRLVAAHQLPEFESLMSSGIRGEMEARWPPFWSSVAWAAIVTGQGRELSGMYEDVSAEAPGLPLFQAPLVVSYWACPLIGVRRLLVEAGIIRLRVPPREALARPPFWETLTLSGRPTAVVRMPYTYPADEHRATVAVSDWVGIDWQVFGVTTDGPGPFVVPASETSALLKLFMPSAVFDGEMVAALFPRGMPSLSKAGLDALEDVRRGFTIDMQTFAAARDIAQRHPGINIALYLGGWDTVNHALGSYRARAANSDAGDRTEADALNRALDHYLEFLDHNLQQLRAAFTTRPNVVVVSDHGFERDWHQKDAMFLASGPGVQAGPRRETLTYFDVVPTLLDLQGLAKPISLPGNSILSR